MRRFRRFAVVGAGLLIVAGCSSSSAPKESLETVVPTTTLSVSPTAAPGETATGTALVQTADGLLTIDLGTGKSTFLDGLVNANWTRIASVNKGVATIVDAVSGEQIRTASVPEGLHVSAISANGNFIAYSDAPDYGLRGLPKGRTTTRVAIVAPSSQRDAPAKVLDLRGNLIPEAFSTDGRHLFVLDYVPAAAPDHYEVRMIDVATGAMTDVGGRPKELPQGEQMQGNVRTSLYSPSKEMLFTLYSKYGEEGHAFIHAVNLTEKWSYCIDLPVDGHFGDGQATLAMSSDNKLYVIGDSGQVAQVDAQPYGLKVERMVQLPSATPAKERPTAAVDGTRLVVGHDDRVFFVDRSALRLSNTMTMTSPVIGLTSNGTGNVAIATEKAIDMVGTWADTRRTGLDTKLPVIVRFGLE